MAWQTIYCNEYPPRLQNQDLEEETANFLQQHTLFTTPRDHANPNNLTHHLEQPITIQEYQATINSMKDKAPGFSGIRRIHLTRAPLNITQAYLKIFNAFLSCGTFPLSFKRSTMIFIPKQNNLNVTQQRPISLLEVPGKVLEKILYTRISTHFTMEDKITHRQFGFRPGRGTTSAIALIWEQISQLRAKGQNAIVACRDVSKAFDRVWHNGLKKKIVESGLPPMISTMMCSFLDSRSARIRIGEHFGPPFPLETGVPQGGCLSPLLYILYINDMPEPQHPTENTSFADDTTQLITVQGKNKQRLTLHAAQEIQRLNNYETNCKINTNTNKFKLILVPSLRVIPPIQLKDGPLEYSNKGKILGFTLSSSGMAAHVSATVGRATAQLISLFRFRHLNSHIKLILYKTLVLPLLLYPPVPLNAANKTNMSKLQRVQNKAIRFITNTSRREHITSVELHRRVGLEPINVLLHRRALSVWRSLRQIGDPILPILEMNHAELSPQQKKLFPPALLAPDEPTPLPQYL